MAPNDLPDVQKYFLQPLFAGLTHAAELGGRRRGVCVGLHARQANAPPQYMEKQGNHAVLPYNEWLGGACEEGAGAAGLGSRGGGKGSAAGGGGQGVDAAYAGLWDTFAFTLNHTSHDGAHYDSRVNVMLAQILLNLVAGEMLGGARGGAAKAG